MGQGPLIAQDAGKAIQCDRMDSDDKMRMR